MTLEEILDKLIELRKRFLDENADTYIALTRAIRAVKHEAWIPVTEALPEADGEYLVTVVDDIGTRRRKVSSFAMYDDGTCYTWGIETGPIYTVVAWAEMMPVWEEEKDG